MIQKKQLLPILNEEIYGTLWKSHHTKEYILDFLNCYFHFSGEDKIRDIEIINPKQFTNQKEVKKRIHVTFEYLEHRYYYEIKLSDELHKERFDYQFLDFVRYVTRAELPHKVIGQIILEFRIEHTGSPIDHYYFRNDHLELLEDSFDIHVIYLPTLKHILDTKCLEELNRFERWIMIFMTDDFRYGKKIADGYTPMLSFLHVWNQTSRRMLEENIAVSEEKTIEYLVEEKERNTRMQIAKKLLLDDMSIELITKVTGLPISTVIELRRELGDLKND